MSTSPAAHRMPSGLLYYYITAVSEQMGAYSLNLVLRQAGLERFIDMPSTRLGDVQSAEFSNFVGAIHDYFGRGARGYLLRVGEAVFRDILKNASTAQKMQLMVIKSLPQSTRVYKMLEFTAAQWQSSPGEVSVHSMDQDLLFVDRTGRCKSRRIDCEPECWATVGMLQEALFWATAKNIDVEEIACSAQGSSACKFKVSGQNRS